MCLSLGPPGNSGMLTLLLGSTDPQWQEWSFRKKKKRLGSNSRPNGSPMFYMVLTNDISVCPGGVCSARGPSPGKQKEKEFTQVQTKEKKEENSSAWLSPFFYSYWSVLLPHTSGCIIWLLYQSFGMSFQCTSSYLEFGFKKSPQKHKVLFLSPMNLVTEPEVST